MDLGYLREHKKNYFVQGNLAQTFLHGPMKKEGHAKKCVERYCGVANKTTQQLYKVSTPCIDDHHFKEEEMGFVGKLLKVCPEMPVFGTHW